MMISNKIKFLNDLITLIETSNDINEIKKYANKYNNLQNSNFNPEDTRIKMDTMEKMLMDFDKKDLANYIVVKTYLSDN